MIRNIFIITLRNLQRQFLYSAINIIGLAVGMACSLVIFLYVYGEWSHDKHFKRHDHIYRIGISFFGMGEFAVTTELLGEYLPKQFAGIDALTRFAKNDNEILFVGEKEFHETVFNADSSFFRVFSYQPQQGDLKRALIDPTAIVLTESMALKFFGSSDVIGRVIEVGKEKKPFAVTAIVDDDIRTSHLKAKIWISNPYNDTGKRLWSSASSYTYVMLKPGITQLDLKHAIDRLIETEVFPSIGRDMGKATLEEYVQDPNSVRFHITPLKDIYLKSKANFELSPGGNETNMIVFTAIAGFILLLAAVNFVNLSTARATRRAKEVGIRKSLGTKKTTLIGQFLLESILVSVVSMIIALGLAELFTFTFFWITGQTLAISLWMNFYTIASVFLLALIVGFIAGLYPAFYLTAFSPVKVLKGSISGAGGSQFRNGLVVFQFAISICLIICTTIILRQLTFMSSKDLGFDQENVITINNTYSLKNPFAFRDEILRHRDVVSASLHSGQPGSKKIISYSLFASDTLQQPLSIFTYFGDENLQKVMGYKLVEGRWFDGRASDSSAVILNRSALASLGIADNALETILNDGYSIIGVVEDFHWESLRNNIGPVAFMYENHKPRRINRLAQLSVKVRASQAQSFLSFARGKWSEFEADDAMDYHFIDENFEQLLAKEQVFAKAIGFFTILAIAISCLGLFGLSAYTTEQRTKEIGIRKTLGATSTNIVFMLNAQFAKLVVIAILIAVPIAFLMSKQWLDQFAYKTPVEIWIYLIGAAIALTISWLTVGFQSLKASKTNPAETLKCD